MFNNKKGSLHYYRIPCISSCSYGTKYLVKLLELQYCDLWKDKLTHCQTCKVISKSLLWCFKQSLWSVCCIWKMNISSTGWSPKPQRPHSTRKMCVHLSEEWSKEAIGEMSQLVCLLCVLDSSQGKMQWWIGNSVKGPSTYTWGTPHEERGAKLVLASERWYFLTIWCK